MRIVVQIFAPHFNRILYVGERILFAMKLEDNTFLLYASKCYDNPHCNSFDEFEEDLDRLKHIKKLIMKYVNNGNLNERLILNHIIIFYNCFGEGATNILFMKLEKQQKYIIPFLKYLNVLPITVEYNKKIIFTDSIDYDEFIVERLEKI